MYSIVYNKSNCNKNYPTNRSFAKSIPCNADYHVRRNWSCACCKLSLTVFYRHPNSLSHRYGDKYMYELIAYHKSISRLSIMEEGVLMVSINRFWPTSIRHILTHFCFIKTTCTNSSLHSIDDSWTKTLPLCFENRHHVMVLAL